MIGKTFTRYVKRCSVKRRGPYEGKSPGKVHGASSGKETQGYERLVVVERYDKVAAAPARLAVDLIRWQRPFHEISFFQFQGQRQKNFFLLRSYIPAFAGVRVQAADERAHFCGRNS